MSVQQNVTDFRQTLRDRISLLGGVAEPVAVANGELTLTGSSSTDFDILNNIGNPPGAEAQEMHERRRKSKRRKARRTRKSRKRYSS